MALNAIKHGLSMPLSSALGQPDGQDHPALQAIAELIAPECTSLETARCIASTILEFERNETAQREFFMSCCVEPQGLPAGAELIEAVRQRYPEYDMMQELMDEELQFKSRPDRRWIAKGMKIMQNLQQEFIQTRQQEQTEAVKRWRSSQRYLKRAANQLAKALRADTRGQPCHSDKFEGCKACGRSQAMQVSYLTQCQGMNDLFFAKQSQWVGCGAKSRVGGAAKSAYRAAWVRPLDLCARIS